MFSQIYHSILYQPLLNLLVGIYNIVPFHDIGVTIVLLTIIIRFVLYPFTKNSLAAQRKMQLLQPKLDAIKKEFKDKKEVQAMEMMKLYKENNINPLSSCLPILLQLPILIALYHVFQESLSGHTLTGIYSFLFNPGQLNAISFGVFDLAKASIPLAVLAAGAQFWSSKLMVVKKPSIQSEASKDEEMAAIMNKQMLYLMPALTFIIGFSIPAGLTLYWLVTTLFMVGQQYLVIGKKEPTVEVVKR